jgi:hypothetical protein
MKLRFILLLVAALSLLPRAFGQGSSVGANPVITTPAGQPVPFAAVAICTTDPGPFPNAVCGNLANTYIRGPRSEPSAPGSPRTRRARLPLNNRSNPLFGRGLLESLPNRRLWQRRGPDQYLSSPSLAIGKVRRSGPECLREEPRVPKRESQVSR